MTKLYKVTYKNVTIIADEMIMKFFVNEANENNLSISVEDM